MNIIDGKAISKKIREEIKLEVDRLKKSGIIPGLAVIIVGDDKASRIYVNNKKSMSRGWNIFGRVCLT